MPATRNQSEEFARRTLKNLRFIIEARSNKDDVHVVTQAILSTLGLVIFPWEDRAIDAIKNRRLPQLTAQGWPRWQMTLKPISRLGDLLEMLRNSVAHGNIAFSSDSRSPQDVTITFINLPKGATQPDWSGTIQGDDLIIFCERLTIALLNQLE